MPKKKFEPFKKKECEGEECDEKPMKEGTSGGLDHAHSIDEPVKEGEFDLFPHNKMAEGSPEDINASDIPGFDERDSGIVGNSPMMGGGSAFDDIDTSSFLDSEIDGPGDMPQSRRGGDIEPGEEILDRYSHAPDRVGRDIRSHGADIPDFEPMRRHRMHRGMKDPRMENRANEKEIVESISNFLRDKANLGLPGKKDAEETEHVAQARIEGLYETFALKFVESPFYESVTGAFRKIHSYKYLDHPTFKLSLESELKSMGVPVVEITKALSEVDSLVEGFSKDPGERDSGWNIDQLEDLMDMTRNADRRKPKHEDPRNTPMKGTFNS